MSSDASTVDPISPESHDREMQILEHIAAAQNVRQRDIARIVGTSLGMTNAILKRLARKGLITIRKVNNRNIMYAVSARGFDQIARRSYGYLRRTIRNVVVYKETIESLIGLVVSQGFDEIDVVEESDLDFIVEHACEHAGLAFRRVPTSPDGIVREERNNPAVFVLHSERREPPSGRRKLDDLERAIVNGECEAYLSELLI